MFEIITPYDEQILNLLHQLASGLPYFVNKFFTEFLVYLLPIALLVLFFNSAKSKLISIKAFFSVVLGWFALSTPLGILLDRERPFAGGGVQELLFHRPTHSFPSDHATALFAFAFALYFFGYKKLGHVFLSVAIINSLFRIATGIHWPSDIVGGIAIALIASYIIKWLDKPLKKFYDFILKILKVVKLA